MNTHSGTHYGWSQVTFKVDVHKGLWFNSRRMAEAIHGGEDIKGSELGSYVISVELCVLFLFLLSR